MIYSAFGNPCDGLTFQPVFSALQTSAQFRELVLARQEASAVGGPARGGATGEATRSAPLGNHGDNTFEVAK